EEALATEHSLECRQRAAAAAIDDVVVGVWPCLEIREPPAEQAAAAAQRIGWVARVGARSELLLVPRGERLVEPRLPVLIVADDAVEPHMRGLVSDVVETGVGEDDLRQLLAVQPELGQDHVVL